MQADLFMLKCLCDLFFFVCSPNKLAKKCSKILNISKTIEYNVIKKELRNEWE